MGDVPFNLKLPDNALPARKRDGTQVGWVWQAMMRRDRAAEPSLRHRIEKELRWTSCTMDGKIISRSGRTQMEATKTLSRAVARRARAALLVQTSRI